MQGNLSTSTAIALIGSIEHYLPTDFETLGITPEQFDLLAQPLPWLRETLPELVRVMNALIFGTIEKLTLPKLVVPAEYVACVISAVVHPTNIMAMCIIMSQERATGVGALELASRNAAPTAIDHTSADQLFALCAILTDKDRANQARVRLKEQLGIRIEKAMRGQ